MKVVLVLLLGRVVVANRLVDSCFPPSERLPWGLGEGRAPPPEADVVDDEHRAGKGWWSGRLRSGLRSDSGEGEYDGHVGRVQAVGDGCLKVGLVVGWKGSATVRIENVVLDVGDERMGLDLGEVGLREGSVEAVEARSVTLGGLGRDEVVGMDRLENLA